MEIVKDFEKLPMWGKIGIGGLVAGAAFLYFRSSGSAPASGPGQVDQTNAAPSGGGFAPSGPDIASMFEDLKNNLISDQQSQFDSIGQAFSNQQAMVEKISTQQDLFLNTSQHTQDQLTGIAARLHDITNVRPVTPGERIGDNGNGTVHDYFIGPGGVDSHSTPAGYADQSTIIGQMKRNGIAWLNASDAQRKQLHNESDALGKSIGATYDAGSGNWMKNGKVLF